MNKTGKGQVLAFEKETLAQAAVRFSAENIELHALLIEVGKEIRDALVSDEPAEVLEALLLKVEAVNKTW